MKKILIAFCVLIVIGLIGFWNLFIRSKTVTDNNLVSFCKNKDHIKVETAESAKYISGIQTVISKDTIEITVSTTTMQFFFAYKEIRKDIVIDSNIKYIKLANKVTRITSMRDCDF